MKNVLTTVIVALILATTLAVVQPDVAQAASSCGSRTSTQEYGVSVPLAGWQKTVTHTAKSRSCENDTSITSNNYESHSCNKTLIAFANSITKSRTIGRAGGPEATNVYECNFYGGLIWKGVGIGVTRDLFIRHRAYIKSGALWYSTSTWSSCC